jgi:hypothetical protein
VTRRPAHRSRKRQRAQLRSLIVLGLIVAVVAVVLVVRATRGDDGDGSTATATTASPATTSTQPGATTTTAAATPSTAAANAPELVASDGGGRRYSVAAGPFTVRLGFTSLCWVEARRGGSDGQVLVADAFNAGDAPEFTESAIWIRLGYPAAATVTVNGVALAPVGGTDPFNIEITVASSG